MSAVSTSSLRLEIGKHLVLVENGVLQVQFNGNVSLEEATRIQEAIYDAGERFGPLAAIADLNNPVHFESGARTLLVKPPRPYPFYVVSYFGGSFAARTLMMTMMRAGKLLVPSAFTFEMEGFATEEEARRYLETARQNRTQSS